MSGEAASRARIDLPGRGGPPPAAVMETGRPVIVLLFSGRPLAIPEVFARAAAVSPAGSPAARRGTPSPRS